MPNKTVVGQYLDELSPAAEMCGAVNTIVNDNGNLTGHITDGIGFMQALKDNDIDVIGKKMTIAEQAELQQQSKSRQHLTE